MAAIERHDDVGPKTLRQYRDCRIRATERKVAVAFDEIGDRRPVLGSGGLNFQRRKPAQEIRLHV